MSCDISPASILYDASGNAVAVMTEQTAQQLLTQLRIINVHLASLSGEEITSEDVQ